MKLEYELYFRTYSSINPGDPDDLETVDFEPCLNYRDAVKQAKKQSKGIPYKDSFGREILQIQIAAYYGGEEAEEEFGTSYHLVWKETFVGGKSLGRC